VVVTEVRPDSIAAGAGIRPGTVIREANRRPMNTAEEFRQAVSQSTAERRVLLLIRQENVSRYVVLSLGPAPLEAAPTMDSRSVDRFIFFFQGRGRDIVRGFSAAGGLAGTCLIRGFHQ